MTGNFSVIHNQQDNRFEVDLPGGPAVLLYTIKSGLFILIHAEVPPPFEGKGIAGLMAQEALEYARRKGYRVRSYCSFTTLYIERHKEYQGLLG